MKPRTAILDGSTAAQEGGRREARTRVVASSALGGFLAALLAIGLVATTEPPARPHAPSHSFSPAQRDTGTGSTRAHVLDTTPDVASGGRP